MINAVAVMAIAALAVLTTACATERVVYVLPDGTEVTATPAPQTARSGETKTVPPTFTPVPPTLTRAEMLIEYVIENKPQYPDSSGYGWHRSRSFSVVPDDCAMLFYVYGRPISGRPPYYSYSGDPLHLERRGLDRKVIDCDKNGSENGRRHYFVDESEVDPLWSYLVEQKMRLLP